MCVLPCYNVIVFFKVVNNEKICQMLRTQGPSASIIMEYFGQFR